MSTNQTANYQLTQWTPEDPVLREEFNADNAKIDAALAQLSRPAFAVGVLEDYDGSADVTVELGRQPAMVMVGNRFGWTNSITGSSTTSFAGHSVALPGCPGYLSTYSAERDRGAVLEVTETGFILRAGFASYLKPFRYLALF